MNKKQVLTAMVALALPIVTHAADVPVQKASMKEPVKKVSTSMAPQNMVGERISSTASPTVNKAVRENSDKVKRDAKTMMIPAAKAYTERLQVSVHPIRNKDNHFDVTYPVIESASPYVEEKINKRIDNYINDLQNKVIENNKKAGTMGNTNLYVTYDVKSNSNGILSVLIKSYTIEDKAAHGLNFVKGLTFNTTTGKELSLSDFGGINKNKIKNALMDAPDDVKMALFKDVEIEKAGEFYAMPNHDIYLVFQQGDYSPMAAGTVYVPVGNLGR